MRKEDAHVRKELSGCRGREFWKSGAVIGSPARFLRENWLCLFQLDLLTFCPPLHSSSTSHTSFLYTPTLRPCLKHSALTIAAVARGFAATSDSISLPLASSSAVLNRAFRCLPSSTVSPQPPHDFHPPPSVDRIAINSA